MLYRRRRLGANRSLKSSLVSPGAVRQINARLSICGLLEIES
jgi:hypothetical protein